MADTATLVQPVAPSPTVATTPAIAPPPPSPPPLSTLTEKASQFAGKISTQPQFEQALTSVGGATLPPEAKAQLWDTVNKTRVGQGLPPLTVAATPPGAAPPVSTAPAAAPPTTAAPAAPLKQVPGQDAVPVTNAPPAPTAKYEAPNLETATYKAPEYKPPNKGLEYAAMALSLLFPGAPIGRAAAGFAQGLNQGAQQNYKRQTDAAKQQYESERDKDATINQGRLAQAAGNLTAAQQYDKWVATKTSADNTTQANIYTDRQNKRAQGLDPNTGKPFVPPGGLAKPPPPQAGYDGLAQWHQARSLWFEQQGATGPAAQEAAAAKEAITQATNAANNARSLFEAAQRQRTEIALHNDTESNANYRHDDTMFHEDARARTEYGVRATGADKSLFSTWQQYTKPQTKTVEIKDVNGNVTGIHTVPLVDDKGNPVPAPISGQLAGMLTKMVNLVRNDRDPQGAAAYYGAHLGNDPGGLVGQEILQQAGEAGALRLMANGRMPQEHAWPKITEPPAPKAPPAPVAVVKPAPTVGLTGLHQHAPPPPPPPPHQPTPEEIAGTKATDNFHRALGQPPPAAHADHPKFANPPGLPQGAKYVGPGPSGGDQYQFPDGSHQEYTGP